MLSVRNPDRLMPLGPGQPEESMRAELSRLTPETLFETPVRRHRVAG